MMMRLLFLEKGSTTALEPSYFDKTQDYSSDDPTIAYFLTCQNVGVTTNEMREKNNHHTRYS